jgi:hypothetical protein
MQASASAAVEHVTPSAQISDGVQKVVSFDPLFPTHVHTMVRAGLAGVHVQPVLEIILARSSRDSAPGL